MNTETNRPKIWGLVGLGWLGSALAKNLNGSGQNTWGTHRDSFDFTKNPFPDTFCDVLFLNTPPITDLLPGEYIEKIHLHAKAKIIFTSSISVYGRNTKLVNELSPVAPLTTSAKWLCEVEKLLLQKFGSRLLILRLGGLIGNGRHPINSLSGKTNVPGGDDVINLVHLSDLISIIIILEKIGNLALVNVVTPFHPSKNFYYNEWAKRLKIPPVAFSKSDDVKEEVGSQHLQSIYPQWLVQKLDRL